jgi:predicted nucleic-acid-binding protein
VIAIDTNVLIRFLVRDDEHQAMRARNLVENCRATGDTCLVSHPVLCELEWVLESAYRASRSEIAASVRMLLTTPPFVLEDSELLERALQMYSKGKGDLSDYILGEIAGARGARTTYTFDRDLRNTEGFTLLQ